MSRAKKMPVLLVGGASVLTALLAALLLAGGLFGLHEAEATQPPPPPPSYTVTVNTSGGDSTCEVQILAPTETAWGSTASGTFTSGTGVDLRFRVTCPSGYAFDHWESNNEDLDGQTNHGGHSGDFTLYENTTATAVFLPVVLPDAESTIWHDHYTQSPHWGDMYWHQVSSSSNPTYSFAGLVINEDFLIAEMDTSGCSMTLTQQQKEGFQNSWDSDWLIDSNNYRQELNGAPPNHKYDSHGFNPDAAPWDQIQSNEVFRLTQRMRVKGCPSTNNQGPWFATHSIHFKVVYNTQLAKREVFVKKSGVQGTGDPSF
ncbi:MAG: hypothetical protein JNK74_05335 [Candidatus Hydrogenedentes bacterium]|nr:hypothetical protein [Candidatus Hydrogenedentota bacterium]